MSFLGLDLGTSFIKGAVLHLESRRLEHVRRTPFPPPLVNANPLLCEVDPTAILAAARAADCRAGSPRPGLRGDCDVLADARNGADERPR